MGGPASGGGRGGKIAVTIWLVCALMEFGERSDRRRQERRDHRVGRRGDKLEHLCDDIGRECGAMLLEIVESELELRDGLLNVLILMYAK